MKWMLAGLSAVVGLALFSGCEFNPSDVDVWSLSHCASQPGTLGFGYHPDVDPLGGTTHYGTEGDDIVVLTSYPVAFDGLGGDDLICIQGDDAWNGAGQVIVNGGEGNDTIIDFEGWPSTLDGGPGENAVIDATTIPSGTPVLDASADSPQPCNAINFTVTNTGGGLLSWAETKSGSTGTLGAGESDGRTVGIVGGEFIDLNFISNGGSASPRVYCEDF